MASRKHEDDNEEGSYQSPGSPGDNNQSNQQDQPGSPANQSKRRRFDDEIDSSRRNRDERTKNERDEPNHRTDRDQTTVNPSIKGLPDHSDNFEMRFLIEASLVGSIIGRGGLVIKKLRDDYGAFINILQDPPGVPPARERVMIIRANPAALVATLGSIVGLCNERLSASREDPNGQAQQPIQPPVSKLVALVHRVVVGAVIGKGGETIRNTMNETGARIQVSGEVLPNSTDKSVTITGSQEQVVAALEKVIRQLQTTSVKPGTPTLPYTPSMVPRYPAAGGFPSGGPMGGPMGGPEPRGAMPFYPPMPAQSMQRFDDRRQYDRAPMPVGPPFQPPMSSMAPYHPAAPRGFEGGDIGPLSEQKIAIPSVCAGCVIGRGGEVIKTLRAQSGCSIQVENADAGNPNERFVIIKGTQNNIQNAVRLITQCVESYRPRE